MSGKEVYYKMWAYFQKNDVMFFCLPEKVQDMIVIFGVISLTQGICKYLSKYGFFKSKNK